MTYMKRRKFLQVLFGSAVGGAVAATGFGCQTDNDGIKRYRATDDLMSHGHDAPGGGMQAGGAPGAIRQGDILVRLETEDTCRETTFERLYNETQDTIVWFWREPGFWSDQKLNSDPLPTWFERVS